MLEPKTLGASADAGPAPFAQEDGTCSFWPTLIRLGLLMLGLATRRHDVDVPQVIARSLRVSPDLMVYVPGAAGQAAWRKAYNQQGLGHIAEWNTGFKAILSSHNETWGAARAGCKSTLWR